MWDWSICRTEGARFENLVASNLLKQCHFIEDTQGDEMQLCSLCDKMKREVDFVVLKNRKPIFAVECKTGETGLSKHITYFSERTEIPFYQVHKGHIDYEIKELKIRVPPFHIFVSEILQV